MVKACNKLEYTEGEHFMICVDNRGYKSSLEVRKIYEVLTDRVAEKHHQISAIANISF